MITTDQELMDAFAAVAKRIRKKPKENN